MAIEKEDFITEDHLNYLDELQESGVTNMLGAASYIQDMFLSLSMNESREVLNYWMESWSERHGVWTKPKHHDRISS